MSLSLSIIYTCSTWHLQTTIRMTRVNHILHHRAIYQNKSFNNHIIKFGSVAWANPHAGTEGIWCASWWYQMQSFTAYTTRCQVNSLIILLINFQFVICFVFPARKCWRFWFLINLVTEPSKGLFLPSIHSFLRNSGNLTFSVVCQ